MKDNLHTRQTARAGIMRGIYKCAEAVGGTMGTGGHNAIIEAIESPGHLTTNDGATILESLSFVDPLEEMGRKILLEAVKRANKQSGDGSSTTTVLTAATIREGIAFLDKASPMEIKNSLDACIPLLEKAIDSQKRSITVDTVGQVATISAEDEKIGALIQEIYQQIGKDGIIHWDISKTFDDHYTIGTGITVDGAGMVSPYMADIDEKNGQFLNVARWKNPAVLITKQKITTAADFNDLFQTLDNRNIKEIVIFCDEYEATVIPALIQTRAVRGFKAMLVKMPVLWKDWWYEDLSKVTGATVIDPNAGISFKSMKTEHLGRVDNITVTKTDTYIDGMKDVSEHIAALEAENTDDSKLRASRLNTKTARYFVGAPSDSALSYRRLKVEDAISASWQALQNGIVAGGGTAFVQASRSLPDTVGGQILKKALLSVTEQVIKNAGYTVWNKKPAWYRRQPKESVVIGTDFDGVHGFDTKTHSFVDMFSCGIVDPANIVLNAARNAISVAASVLTGSVVVTLPRPDIADQLVHSILSRNIPQ